MKRGKTGLLFVNWSYSEMYFTKVGDVEKFQLVIISYENMDFFYIYIYIYICKLVIEK